MNAHEQTDFLLKRMEKQIKTEYTKAYKEVRKQMNDIMSFLAEHPGMDAKKVMEEMNKYNRLQKLSEQMADTILNANDTAVKFISKTAVNIYGVNYNADAEKLGFSIIDNTAIKNILTKNVNPFNRLAIDALQDRGVILRNLKSELITGILTGESIPKIAERIKGVIEDKNLAQAVRIARTETTRAENSAHHAIGEEGEKRGFKMGHEWIATNDDRTRGGHIHCDGQKKPLDEPFDVEIYKKHVVKGKEIWEPTGIVEQMMFPGDESLGASAENIINCRCTESVFIIETK